MELSGSKILKISRSSIKKRYEKLTDTTQWHWHINNNNKISDRTFLFMICPLLLRWSKRKYSISSTLLVKNLNFERIHKMTTLSHAFSGGPHWSRRLFCRRLVARVSTSLRAPRIFIFHVLFPPSIKMPSCNQTIKISPRRWWFWLRIKRGSPWRASVGNKASKQDKSSGPGRDPLYAIVGVAHHINKSSDFISPPASGVNKEEQHSAFLSREIQARFLY
jgi:hypothetical protein